MPIYTVATVQKKAGEFYFFIDQAATNIKSSEVGAFLYHARLCDELKEAAELLRLLELGAGTPGYDMKRKIDRAAFLLKCAWHTMQRFKCVPDYDFYTDDVKRVLAELEDWQRVGICAVVPVALEFE